MVDAGWGGTPPGSAAHQIRKAVADLRRLIPGGHELIITSGPGYRAAPGVEQLDLTRYRSALRQAREAIECLTMGDLDSAEVHYAGAQRSSAQLSLGYEEARALAGLVVVNSYRCRP